MNPEAYVEMAKTEATHWWFRGRRDILEAVINHMQLRPTTRILEVGSGTGGNLAMLAAHGAVSAFEMNPQALRMSKEKATDGTTVIHGSCPDEIPYADTKFDLICMFDVLEHITKDVQTLAALRERLGSGGRILVTVPAYRWLWGPHDIALHHKRRYTAASLRKTFAAAGLHMERVTYFNMLLLPLAALSRLWDRLTASAKPSGTSVPPSMINAALLAIFRTERKIVPKWSLPTGVSLLGIARAD